MHSRVDHESDDESGGDTEVTTDEKGTKALIEERNILQLYSMKILELERKLTLIHVMEELVVDEGSNLSQRGKLSLNRTNLAKQEE